MKQNIIKTTWMALGLLLAGTPSALGQWQTQSFDLKPGWNAIYLHVDATHATIEALAGGSAVEEVWLWQPRLSTAQYVTNPDAPSDAKSRWASWKAGLGDASSVLKRMPGNAAYLVKLGGEANVTWNIKGKPVPPRYQWTTSGLNFLGVPSVAANPKSLEDYFGQAGDLLRVTEIFAYGGGTLGTANPAQVYGLRTTLAKRGQAFWLRSGTRFNRYFGPFEARLQSGTGAHFGSHVAAFRVRLRNLTAADLTVSLAGVASETPPDDQAAITAAAPVLVRGALDTSTLSYALAALSDGAQSWTLKPLGQAGSEVEVVLGLDRPAMNGGAGAYYASLLRFTDSLGHSQVDIPVSGSVASNEGLWVGDVNVTHVRNTMKAADPNNPARSISTDTTDFGAVASPYPLRLILHRESFSGLQSVDPGVTASGTAAQGAGVTVGVNALSQPLATGRVLRFSGGGTLTLTADAPVGVTELTGDLADADIAADETVPAGAAQGNGVTIPVAATARPLYAGETLAFSGGGQLELTANAPLNSTLLTGNLTGADVATGETAGANRLKLLQRVYVGTLPGDVSGVATKESLLKAGSLANALRISSIHLPVSGSNLPWNCAGDLVQGQTLTTTVEIGHGDRGSNPFLHAYHPDHDNLSADFKTTQPVGRESYRIKREIQLTFTPPGNGFGERTRTGKRLAGTYEETMTLYGQASDGAANEKSYAMKGAFVLNRISDIATLTME
ncbi:MAG: hypothetical protein H8E20_08205 [Verrucomicrobia bacterium]|nr:hypothetical protein [Verrucomicrobiota bacterium]